MNLRPFEDGKVDWLFVAWALVLAGSSGKVNGNAYVFSFLYLPAQRFSQQPSYASVDASTLRKWKDARGLPWLIFTHVVLFHSQPIFAQTQVAFLQKVARRLCLMTNNNHCTHIWTAYWNTYTYVRMRNTYTYQSGLHICNNISYSVQLCKTNSYITEISVNTISNTFQLRKHNVTIPVFLPLEFI